MRQNLSISKWLENKFGENIPNDCLDAHKENFLSLLPPELINSYKQDLEFPMPLFLPNTKLYEIGIEYQQLAEAEIKKKESDIELGNVNEEDIDITDIALLTSVSNSIINSTNFYPDFDYLSKEIIEELKKEDSQKSWEESMGKYGFNGNWEELYNLFSPVGLMNAYTWMSSIDISATDDSSSEEKEYVFGELFKGNAPEWKVYIPVTIFSRYKTNDQISKKLKDYQLVNEIIKESGITFSYNVEMENNTEDKNKNPQGKNWNIFKKIGENRKRIAEEKEALLKKSIEEKKLKKEKEENAAKQKAESWSEQIIKLITDNKDAIYKDYQNSQYTDQYGNEESDFFDFEELYELEDLYGLSNYEFQDEIDNKLSSGFNYFFKSVILRDIEFNDFIDGWKAYEKIYSPRDKDGKPSTWQSLLVIKWLFEYSIFPIAKAVDEYNQKKLDAGFDDDMSGEEFETYCANILIEAGWNVEQTPSTNDQGTDLIAYVEDYKVCIQCKKYSNPVGNKAVQEIIAGTLFYQGTHSVVVSNAGFTKSAISLAKSSNVILLNDSELEELENFI